MGQYLILHRGFEPPKLEEMAAWNKWFDSIADRLVERKGLADGREITHSGVISLPFGKDSITGLTIIEAGNLDEAAKIAAACPIVAATSVYELR